MSFGRKSEGLSGASTAGARRNSSVRRRGKGAQPPVHFDRYSLARILADLDLGFCLTKTFAGCPHSPLRYRIDAPRGREILLMPAYRENFSGAKVLCVIPDNAEAGRPVISGLFLLFDFQTGAPLATMDAGELTAWRTAAVSALAAKVLAKDSASELTILGAGHLAPYLARAIARVRPIRRVNIWARRREEANRVTRLLRGTMDGVEVSACTELRQAVESADIVSSATRSQAPLISGDWLRAGAHVDLVGGYRPDMRELDDRGIQKGKIFVDSYESALAEAGDLTDPLSRGIISRDGIAGDLYELVSGKGRRTSSDEITIFKSVGTGVADLAVAVAVWEDSLSADSYRE